MKISEVRDHYKIEYPFWRMLNSSFFKSHSATILVKDGAVKYIAFFNNGMWFVLDWGVDTGAMMLDLWTISFVALTETGEYKLYSGVILSEILMLDVIDRYTASAPKYVNGECAIQGIKYESDTFYNWLSECGYEYVELNRE